MVAFGYGARSFLGRLAVVVLFLIALELLSLAAPASGQATLASIIGVVTDTSNSILPGVTVSATGPALQVPQVTAVTNERGEYRLGLPPGTYTLMFELAGFQQVKREGVRLAVGFTATIDQSMSLGTVEETITVSGQSPLVDVTNPATSVDLASDALELLPTTRDGLKAFMAQVPGMRTNLDVGASSMTDTIVIRAYGQQGAPWQMLEGIMFASSGGNGVQGAHVDFNSIESTRLQTVGSSAEMPRRGPFIDSIVKSVHIAELPALPDDLRFTVTLSRDGSTSARPPHDEAASVIASSPMYMQTPSNKGDSHRTNACLLLSNDLIR